MPKGKKKFNRTTEEGAEQLLGIYDRILKALGMSRDPLHAEGLYGGISHTQGDYNYIAFGIGCVCYLRLKPEYRNYARFELEMNWSACSGPPSAGIAQASIIRELSEKACIAEAIANERSAEWTQAECEAAFEILREERREAEREFNEEHPEDEKDEEAA